MKACNAKQASQWFRDSDVMETKHAASPQAGPRAWKRDKGFAYTRKASTEPQFEEQ